MNRKNVPTTLTLLFIIGVLGYYSTEVSDANGAGLYFNPPGTPMTGNTEFTQPERGTCNGETIQTSAQAVVGNTTVVNSGGGFLTLWPSNAARPTAASSDLDLEDTAGAASHTADIFFCQHNRWRRAVGR